MESGRGRRRRNEEERENARPSSSLLERALVIRTETASSAKKRIFDRKFTGYYSHNSSKQLRFIFGERNSFVSLPLSLLELLNI